MGKIILIVVLIFVLLAAVFFLMTRQEGEQRPVEPGTTAEPEAKVTVMVGGNETVGPFLVGSNGMNLYTFKEDKPLESTCYDQCSENWPPLSVGAGEVPVAGAGVGALGVIEREDGIRQVVTFDGQPLYYWANDQNPGDAGGHGINNAWFVAKPFLQQQENILEKVLNNPRTQKATLNALDGSSSSGSAYRLVEDDVLYHVVVATLPDPAEGKAYEGWLVQPSPLEFFPMGIMGKNAKGEWTLEYVPDTIDLFPSYTKVVITEETAVDQTMESRVMEGDF